MMMRASILLLLVGCGAAPAVSTATVSFPLTIADCPVSSLSQIRARATFAGFDTPCDLTVQSQTSGSLVTTGECKNYPVKLGQCGTTAACMGATSVDACKALNLPECKWFTTVTITWFVTSPSGKEITVAFSELQGNLSEPDPGSTVLDVQAKQTPRTRAEATQTAAEKDRFNCDRSGTSVCDSSAPPPATAGADADTCSNLEELCKGTLFSLQNDSCR